MTGWRSSEVEAVNVYAIDAEGKVHDVAYALDAAAAKAMASGLAGGVASESRPDEKKPKKDDD